MYRYPWKLWLREVAVVVVVLWLATVWEQSIKCDYFDCRDDRILSKYLICVERPIHNPETVELLVKLNSRIAQRAIDFGQSSVIKHSGDA